MPEGHTRLHRGQRLSDTGLFERIFESATNTVVASPPNTGKTFAAIRTAYERYKDVGRPFIFAADTTALADDVHADHSASCSDLQLDHGGARGDVDRSKPVITTYDSAVALSDGTDADLLIVDEWHSLVTEYGYRSNAIRALSSTFGSYNQVVGLTGTPAFTAKGYRKEIVVTDRPGIVVRPVTCSNILASVAREIADNSELIHYVSVFDKGYGPRLGEALASQGFNPAFVKSFNADTKGERWVQEFLRSNRLPRDTRVVVGTFTQGFSVRDRGFMVHVVPNRAKHSVLNIAQVAQRFRDNDALHRINLYHSFASDGAERFRPLQVYVEGLKREANRQKSVLWKAARLKGPPNPKTLQAAENQPLRDMIRLYRENHVEANLDEEKRGLLTSSLKLDQLRIRYLTYERQKKNAYLVSAAMRDQMQEYGLVLGEAIECDAEFKPPTGDGERMSQEEYERQIDEA